MTKKNGFTLIELLVATSIMLVVLGGGIASYIAFNERQKVGTSAKELQQLLRSAQIKARAGQRPDTCDKLVAYSVEGAAGGSTIQLYAQCLNGVTPAEVLVQSLQLQNGVMLSQALNIEYKTLHGGVEGFGTVQLDSNYGQSFSFAVDAGGAISEGAFDAQ